MRQTVLITGASGGLGRELAILFAKDGYNLVLVARSDNRLYALKDKLESECGVKVSVFPKDLSEKYAAADVFDYTQSNNIKVDVLVNNAGFGDFSSFADADIKKLHNLIEVNITALMELTHFYLKPMIESGGGKIMNLASTAAFQPGPMMSVYYASKVFVLHFSEGLSVELKNAGVSVTAFCPGPTKTGFSANAELGGSGLLKNLNWASCESAARYGYKKLMQGKVVAIHGLRNKIMAAATKIVPRALTRNIVYRIQR